LNPAAPSSGSATTLSAVTLGSGSAAGLSTSLAQESCRSPCGPTMAEAVAVLSQAARPYLSNGGPGSVQRWSWLALAA
jgi:hypothetical protein